MDMHVSEYFLRIPHHELSAITGEQEPGITDLPTGLAVEGCLTDDD